MDRWLLVSLVLKNHSEILVLGHFSYFPSFFSLKLKLSIKLQYQNGFISLRYDIWSNTVNVASRMDSCGVMGRIQVNIFINIMILLWCFNFVRRNETIDDDWIGIIVQNLNGNNTNFISRCFSLLFNCILLQVSILNNKYKGWCHYWFILFSKVSTIPYFLFIYWINIATI